jgi:hypothetical protein
LGVAGAGIFVNFIMPKLELTVGQLVVVVQWTLTSMTALGAVWAGLEEAVRNQASAPIHE